MLYYKFRLTVLVFTLLGLATLSYSQDTSNVYSTAVSLYNANQYDSAKPLVEQLLVQQPPKPCISRCNLQLDILKSNWIENTVVVYIGKAGASGKDATLRIRLKQYFSFGKGNNIGHYGGRLIWQLKNSKDLLVAWKPLTEEEPRTVEANLIQDFVSQYSKRPFANLSD